MYKLGAFFALFGLLAYLSRASLRVRHSHGFFRFFAAVFVLALILFNVDQWFVDPLSARQMVSWLLLAVSAVLAFCGSLTLKNFGKPSSERSSNVPIAGIERTTVLVRTGIYKHLRHPMYASGIYGTWGVFLKNPSFLGVVFALASSAFWVMSARSEEQECILYFGEVYREYARVTKMFIPRLF
jgi:protein-S-isoprenylcysteine O-methyltransferase Ste14